MQVYRDIVNAGFLWIYVGWGCAFCSLIGYRFARGVRGEGSCSGTVAHLEPLCKIILRLSVLDDPDCCEA